MTQPEFPPASSAARAQETRQTTIGSSDWVLTEIPPQAPVRLPYGEHPSQFVDFHSAAAGPAPLAIMIHGGFWRNRYDLTHSGHLCHALHCAGFATANIEYRRIGDAGAGWPGTFEDVLGAVLFSRDQARNINGQPERTVLIGHSAGGHLALWVAGEIRDLRGVVALAPVADLAKAFELRLSNNAVKELMGDMPLEPADPKTRPLLAPVTVITAAQDDTVPIEVSSGVAGRWVDIPGAGHLDLIDPRSAAWQSVLQEILSVVR